MLDGNQSSIASAKGPQGSPDNTPVDMPGLLQDSQEYVNSVMPRTDVFAVDRAGRDRDDTTCYLPSLLDLANGKLDIVRDAEAYAVSVSQKLGEVLRAPQSVRGGRKKAAFYAR